MGVNAVIAAARKAKIFTVPQLAAWLKCSIPTARRRLREWNAYTSYSRNGQYYALPEIPRFDRDGLWRHKGVSFSQHGNLKRTLVHLVTQSDSGWSASELEALLGLESRSFLSHFRDHPDLCRDKVRGRFIWFASELQTRKRQEKKRWDREAVQAPGLPADSDAVRILVDLIRHPHTSISAMARRLRRQGRGLDPEAIRRLLAHHHLQKKTSDSPRCDSSRPT